MMEKKNIDRLFQEKFRDFEANPPEHVWDRIEEELNKKKKRRVIPIWWKLSGVAALLLIGLAIWNLWQNNGTDDVRVVTAPQIEPVRVDSGSIAAPLTPAPGSLIEGVAESGNDADPASGTLNLQNKGIGQPGERIASEQEPKNLQNREVISPQGRTATAEKSLRTSIAVQAGANNPLNGSRGLTIQDAAENKGLTQKNAVLRNQNAVAASGENERRKTADEREPENDFNLGVTPGEKTLADKQVNQNISPDNQAGPERILSVQEPDKAIAVQDASVKTDSVVVAAAEPNALEELLIEKESEKEKKVTSDAKLNRWQITSNVAPIYFSSASNGSPIDARLEGTNKSYKTSVSYGAGVQYAVNKRFSVRSGVNALALEYATTDIFFMQTPNATPLQNVRTNLQGSLIQIENNPGMVAMTASRGDRRYDGMLNQRIGYIEVPVEMSYQILQKRLGVAVIGGFSTLFLNQNDVSIEGTGLNMTIGEASNLNSMHFSTNLGLGIKYDFIKSLQFKVEPIVKYQLNTFSNDSGNFKPFFLGIYTGLNYRF